MKALILITLFFLFYFITVKDIYDEKMFLTEDVRILENEMGVKDSTILKLKYQNEKLKQQINKMVFVKKPKKQFIKPVVKKQEIITEEVKPQIKDTITQ
jgi:hypothetical protein